MSGSRFVKAKYNHELNVKKMNSVTILKFQMLGISLKAAYSKAMRLKKNKK